MKVRLPYIGYYLYYGAESSTIGLKLELARWEVRK